MIRLEQGCLRLMVPLIPSGVKACEQKLGKGGMFQQEEKAANSA